MNISSNFNRRQVTVWGLRSSYKDIVQREHRSDSLCSEMIGMADKAMQIYASMIGLLLLLPPISSLSPYRSDIYKHDLVETLKQDCLHYVDSPHVRSLCLHTLWISLFSSININNTCMFSLFRPEPDMSISYEIFYQRAVHDGGCCSNPGNLQRQATVLFRLFVGGATVYLILILISVC